MTANDILGWFAASLVFATFCARHMVPLRALAIISNIAFIGYGYLDHLWPIVVLHMAMLPMNVTRFRQALSVVEDAATRRRSGLASGGSATTAVDETRLTRSVSASGALATGDNDVRRYAAAR
jgi:hypothetical protein